MNLDGPKLAALWSLFGLDDELLAKFGIEAPDPGYIRTISGCRWIETNKPDDTVSACPTTEPVDLDLADTRVEWVLENLSNGELHRLYKLLHDGRGIRLTSCDDAVRHWKKGLS